MLSHSVSPTRPRHATFLLFPAQDAADASDYVGRNEHDSERH